MVRVRVRVRVRAATEPDPACRLQRKRVQKLSTSMGMA